MNGKLLKSFFSSGLQAISVQVLGVIFLGIVAYYLSDEAFGVINWSNAVAMFVTTLLGFGLEQVVARRIAASKTSDWAAAAYLFHAFATSLVAIVVVVIIANSCTDCDIAVKYLPLFFIAQCILLFLLPLKQYLNAKHIFTPYGVIAVCSNVLKIATAFILIQSDFLTISAVAYVMMGAAVFEFGGLLAFVLLKTDFRFYFKKSAYKKLLKEAFPQYMSAIFDSTLSRLDWILLGIIASYAATGGYSFAYRAYELARLPIVIIAPIILNIFAKLLANESRITDEKATIIKQLFSVQIYLAVLIPLVFSIIWSPVLDAVFDGKYGSKNETEFLILSICIPIHFFINLLWTLAFSARKYKFVTTITIITAATNLLLNLVLIPIYNGVGAAAAYLITTCVQGTLYYILVYRQIIRMPVITLLLFVAIGGAIYWLIGLVDMHVALKVIISIVAYLGIAYATGKVKKQDFVTLISLVRK